MPSPDRLLPVLKWAGGKRQLVEEILRALPARMETYFEPFVGGGAIFFALAGSGRFKQAIIADKNPELVSVYEALKNHSEKLIRALKEHEAQHSEEHYYRIRDQKPRSRVERAARMIYLNKTGYNGLYRVNKSGQFNVPFGRYKNPRICDEPRLRAAARALEKAEILLEDFEKVCERARPRDGVYLDPPYLPVSRTANFAAYHAESFGISEHERLARVFAELRDRRVPAILSNSSTATTRQIFGQFQIQTVYAARNINSNAARRGAVHELLVSNLPLPQPVRHQPKVGRG